jgi:hypothetical protein
MATTWIFSCDSGFKTITNELFYGSMINFVNISQTSTHQVANTVCTPSSRMATKWNSKVTGDKFSIPQSTKLNNKFHKNKITIRMLICRALGKLVLYVLFGICVWFTYLMTSLAQNTELRMVWLSVQSVLDRASSPTGILWRKWIKLRIP